jgi:hypothetical protein
MLRLPHLDWGENGRIEVGHRLEAISCDEQRENQRAGIVTLDLRHHDTMSFKRGMGFQDLEPGS